MKLLTILLLLIATPALAADVTCTIPTRDEARVTAVCDDLQIQMRARSSQWSLSVCLNELLRRELHSEGVKLSKRNAQRDAAAASATEHPDVVARAVCGDGEKESFEACDDGNLDDGDGCSERCELE